MGQSDGWDGLSGSDRFNSMVNSKVVARVNFPQLALKALARCAKSPALACDIARYFVNDAKSALGIHRYPVHQIFVIGLPKSGTTWLHNMLLELPGFNPRYYPSLSKKDEEGRFLPESEYDNIDNSFFTHAPKHGYSAYRFHIRASDRNLEILTRQANKWVVTYRDLRDVCVSRYFHYKSAPDNHYYPLYQRLPQQEAFDHTIEIMRTQFLPWIQGWREAARRMPGQICEVRYEQLWSDTRNELERVLGFFGIRAPESFFENALATKISAPKDLKESLGDRTRFVKRNTARKGGTGGWREYFTESQKEAFKKFAGDFLIELGYEKDKNW